MTVVLSPAMLLVTVISLCFCGTSAAPNFSRSRAFTRQVDTGEPGRGASGYLPEIGRGRSGGETTPAEREMQPEGRKGSGWRSRDRVVSKRDSDNWHASLTEGDRGGLDTILITNLGKMMLGSGVCV